MALQGMQPGYQRPTVREYGACIVTFQNGGNRYSACLPLSVGNCKASEVANIESATEVANRKDDLIFTNLLYAQCGSGATAMMTFYNQLTAPASFTLARWAGFFGAVTGSTATFTNRGSCAQVGLEGPDFVSSGFQGMLTEEEYLSLDDLASELALESSTSESCMIALGFSSQAQDLIRSLRARSRVSATVCSHASGTGYPRCPWL